MKNLEFTHRRQNKLTGDWVLVSPHRNNRPWLGATEDESAPELPKHDESCPLCPGNERANDTKNPDYKDTFVFVNDFGALTSESNESLTSDSSDKNELFEAQAANGECRVVCFSPDHSKTLPELTEAEITKVVDTWQDNFVELAQQYSCIHIFENKGAVMGCSQPHPHGQIWAHNHLSTEIQKEDEMQRTYQAKHGHALLSKYVESELDEDARIIFKNDHWVALVPYWAAWPFETLLVTRDDIQHFGQLNQQQKSSLAQALKILTTRYDNVFNCSFPYSMGWHNAPLASGDNSHWRLHAHFYPPLLRSATVKKHMVGYEMLAESQRDLTAETAANILNSASDIHYKQDK